MCGREDKKSVFTRTLNPVKEEKVFEVERIYCSDITGSGVRPFPDLVFEVERIIHVALGYKQLMEVERAFRTLKTTLDLRPVYHRKDERITAHVFLCFLALLLVRTAERKTGLTWDKIRSVMERLHLGEFTSKDGRVLQTTELTPEQQNILKQLDIALPRRVQSVLTTP